jgi:hypothetical protein
VPTRAWRLMGCTEMAAGKDTSDKGRLSEVRPARPRGELAGA